MNCDDAFCPDCGDRLIHQSRRGSHESSSALGDFVHNNLQLTMYVLDVDMVVYKVGTKILRVVEHKFEGQGLKPSQLSVLRLLAQAVESLIADGAVDAQSGVFAVWADPPFETARSLHFPSLTRMDLTGEDWRDFLLGDPLRVGSG